MVEPSIMGLKLQLKEAAYATLLVKGGHPKNNGEGEWRW